jgi:hypothetical protein
MATVILEIARGDNLETLEAAGVIAPAAFYAGNGDKFGGYKVVGGTPVEVEIDYSANKVTFPDGATRKRNGYGFGHGQRAIYEQGRSGAYLLDEVFFAA